MFSIVQIQSLKLRLSTRHLFHSINEKNYSLNHIVRLKEQNDQRISELEAEYAQLKIDDAEKLQKLKAIVVKFKKTFI